MTVETTNPAIHTTWTEVRAHPFFAWRTHSALYRPRRDGTLNLSMATSNTPNLDWIVGESLAEVYDRITIRSLWELLSVLGYVPYFEPDEVEDWDEDDESLTDLMDGDLLDDPDDIGYTASRKNTDSAESDPADPPDHELPTA